MAGALEYDELLPAAIRHELLLYVNGKRIAIPEKDVQPELTLLQFLRNTLNLKGTKLGCGEGGCGACTVMVSKYDVQAKQVRHLSVNSCLAPLCAMDTCAITTVEGVGSITGQGRDAEGLHPVQQALAESHGSQCGYCTPGFIMALYSMVKQRETGVEMTMEDIEHGMDGNLCRCTGYRPILDAAKSFGSDAQKAVCKGECEGCPRKGSPDIDIEDLQIDEENGGVKEVSSCSTGKIRTLAKKFEKKMDHVKTHGDSNVFPDELQQKAIAPEYLQLNGKSVQWFAPVTLPQLLQLKQKYNDAKISVGNTEMGIETKFKNLKYIHLINVNRVPELVAIEEVTVSDSINGTVFAGADPFEGAKFGAAVTLTDVKTYLSSRIKSLPSHQTHSFVSIVKMLKWFASTHIRNVACIGGNLVTASPISDMNPLLAAMNAYIELKSTTSTRFVRVRDFFLAYRKVDLAADEIITSVYVPYTKKWEFMLPFKQARRREDDISIVTAGIRVKLDCSAMSGSWIISDVSIVYGGMAPVTKAATASEQFLVGKVFDANTFDEVFDILHGNDFNLPDGVPGGMAKYRESLCSSFLYKFFIATSKTLQEQIHSEALQSSAVLPAAPKIGGKIKSAGESFLHQSRSVSRGAQSFGVEKGGLLNSKHEPIEGEKAERTPVGDPLMHKSAYLQVSGEAVYTDDIPNMSDTLHGALVLSTCAHGIIKSIDPSEALAMEGVHEFFDASVFDTARLGSNKIGPVVKDEECFASEKVVCVGQPVGIIVADTHDLAMAASEKVKVVYEELPSVITIQDAIREKSFILPVHTIIDGDIEKGFAESDIVLEGEVNLGGQEQFYFETNISLCIPQEGGLKVISSTQAATKTQVLVARVLGIDENRVTCSTKRIGGGFGGKETRSVFVACAASVAAYTMKRPVKCLLERHVDMLTTGARHPFYAKYKVGFNRDGKIMALDLDLYNNAGYSMDLSQAVMDRALFHCDNSYKIPNIRANGTVCRTNLATNTAFRGFGGPQGLIVAESYIDQIARKLNLAPEVVRERNMYHRDEVTHFGQPLEDFNLRTLWQHTIDKSGFAAKKEATVVFNAQNRWKKRGVALIPCKFGISFTSKFMNQGGALVHVYTDGSVLVSHGGVEMGQGLHTKVIQVAARAFGIPHEKVHIEETSTNKVPNSQPSAASMSTDLYGMATLDACEQILERLQPIRERLGPKATFSEITNAAYFARVNMSAQGFYIVPNERCGYDFAKSVAENAAVGTAFNYFTTGVACTEVELDVLTGDFHMVSVDILMDLGASVNPAIDIGQIEGAFMQGFGLFALEELVWGDDGHPWVKRGHLFTRGPGAYKIPSANDVPMDFRVWLETNQKNKFAVHSSKAVGEPPLFLGSSAFFAVKEAIYAARKDAGIEGHFELRSPVTPERARMACGDELLQKVFTARGADMLSYQPAGSF
uniref:Xanthine dehydrogenase n=1 Tax=Globisporangium ultimum (strain ATCC 200006 / CBS 805.95 / DAOM BR144) TaxID=431595 RepID=K3WID5_GLOUD